MTERATIKTEWANELVYCCEKHYGGLAAIGRMLMGCAPFATPYAGDEICKNCENEAKAQEQPK